MAGVGRINIFVLVPIALRDLHEPHSGAYPQHIARRDARVPEAGISVPVFLVLIEGEDPVYIAVVHETARGRIIGESLVHRGPQFPGAHQALIRVGKKTLTLVEARGSIATVG